MGRLPSGLPAQPQEVQAEEGRCSLAARARTQSPQPALSACLLCAMHQTQSGAAHPCPYREASGHTATEGCRLWALGQPRCRTQRADHGREQEEESKGGREGERPGRLGRRRPGQLNQRTVTLDYDLLTGAVTERLSRGTW